MAPNGGVGRKGTPDFLLSHADTNMRLAPKPIKSEDSILLEHLFDDLQDEATSEIYEDVKKKLPQVKNPGHWSSDVINGKLKSDILSHTAGLTYD